MIGQTIEDRKPGSITSLFNQYIQGNNQKLEKGWQQRRKIGKTTTHENVVETRQIPKERLFFHIPTNATSNIVVCKLRKEVLANTALYIHHLKITGLPATGLDVIGLHITPMNNDEDFSYTQSNTNLINAPGNTIWFSKTDNSTVTELMWPEPQLLQNHKIAKTWKNLRIQLIDINGNKVTFTSIYLWLFAENMSWFS